MTMPNLYIKESIEVKQRIINDSHLCQIIADVAGVCADTYIHKNKLLICGNGGSASDALHMTGELVGKFQKERSGIPAIALNENVTILTALANDYSYEDVFAKQVIAYGMRGDVLIGISTSGYSQSIVEAAEQAKKQGITVVALTGKTGGVLKTVSDYCINVPSSTTAHIQEAHITIIHYICKIIEERIFK